MAAEVFEFADIHDELRAVGRDLLGRTTAQAHVDWGLFAASGWLGLEVPDVLGGAGATFAEVAVLLEEMGRAATGGPYLGSVVLGVATLNLLTSTKDRDEWLREVAAGGVVVAVALTSGDEVDPGGPPFRLERSAAGLTLHGRAAFVPDAADAGRLLLLADEPGAGPAIVAIEASSERLAVAAQPVLDATRRFGVVAADGVEVAESSLWRFAGDAEASVRRLLDRAAVAIGCDSLGLSEAMLEATVAYAGDRYQFGRPIGSFQAVKHACADLLVQITVARELVAEAVRCVAEDEPDAAVAASMAKSYASGAAVGIVGTALQLHGGIGYTWESGIHVYLKRAALNRSLFGSPAAHRHRLAQRYS
jgi:alkylation response protein AidB-like acyl-CoA dehydrogenase